MELYRQVLAFLTVVGFVGAYPGGPPVGACQHMFPVEHNRTAQNTTAPFEVAISGTKYAGGTEITVTVRNTSDTYFEGLFVQARRVSDNVNETIGSFEVPTGQNLKTMDCLSKEKSAVSQSKKAHYTEKQFTWIAPADFNDDVRFRATIVHETHDFWVDVFSNTMRYDASLEVKNTNGAATLATSVLTIVASALFILH
ncbi:unnamed protein product [Owenia fusiformis]|uniref:Uncharacterized protein n=1 Tax=Owenia fusiformis TaxID=6347 RepID=A0A8J1UWS4_OWEFU|nr:unnamed protein product [Owenia fusiformis]